MRGRTKIKQRDERGFTLIEMVVASSILIIVMTTAVGIIAMIDTQYHNGLVRGDSQGQMLVTMEGVSGVVRGTVTPKYSSYTTGSKPRATSPCWGTNPTPNNSATQPAGKTGAIPKPTATAIVWAHPFDMRFCAVIPSATGSSTPDVVRVWIDPTTCKGTSPNSYCTLLVDSYGPSGTSQPVTKQRWKNVWCTAACQKDNKTWTTTVKSTPALFTYSAKTGSSIVSVAQPIDDLSATDGAKLPSISQITLNVTVLTSNNPATDSGLRVGGKTQIWIQNVSIQNTG